MSDQAVQTAPQGGGENKAGEVDVNSVKARAPSTDNKLTPNSVAGYVENLAKNPASVDIDKLLSQIDPNNEFAPTMEPASRQAGKDDPRPAAPRIVQDEQGRLRDDEGKFVSGRSIEDAEAAAQRGEKPRARTEQAPTQAPVDGKRFVAKTTSGRDVTQEELDLALQIAERETSIRSATDRRISELEQLDQDLRTRSRVVEEAESLRDMFLNDPARAVKFYESTTGKPWPGANQAIREDEGGQLEPDERAARQPRRGREWTEEDLEARVEQKLTARLEQHAKSQNQSALTDRWWDTTGTIIEKTMKGNPEFEGIEQDIEVKVGKELARSIKAKRLALPDYARRFPGSDARAIEHEVKTIVGALLTAERRRLNGWAATRFMGHAETISRTPDPGRGAATIAGASHLDPNTVDLPSNIRGIEDLARKLIEGR